VLWVFFNTPNLILPCPACFLTSNAAKYNSSQSLLTSPSSSRHSLPRQHSPCMASNLVLTSTLLLLLSSHSFPQRHHASLPSSSFSATTIPPTHLQIPRSKHPSLYVPLRYHLYHLRPSRHLLTASHHTLHPYAASLSHCTSRSVVVRLPRYCSHS